MTARLPGLKFAAFAAVCVVAAGFVIQWTGNYMRVPFITTASTYEAELADASGLTVGDDVRLAGVRVGRVQDLHVERGRGVVRFEVDPDVEVTDAWEVGARWRNVIGQRYLYLYAVPGGQPLEPGSRIPLERSRRTADIGRFFNELTPLLRAIPAEQQNRLLGAVNQALDGNTARIQQLVRDLGALGNTLADTEPELRSVLVQGSELLETYNERQEELRGFIAELADVGGTLGARNDELLAAVTDIGEVQEQFGELLRANDDEIRQTVDHLEVITDSIRAQREDGSFEEAIASARAGMATYMLISRAGQWFDVRAVATQVQDGHGGVLYCQTERGDGCYEPNSRKAAGRATSQLDRGGGGPPLTQRSRSGSLPLSVAPVRLPALDVVTGGALRDVPGAARQAAQADTRGGVR